MPFAAGTNCITRAEDALRELLSQNTHFQTFTGTASAAAALARIYTYEVPLPTDSQRDDWSPEEWLDLYPCCTIRVPPGNEWFRFEQTARDQYISFELGISFILTLETVIDPAEDEQEQIRTFLNSACNVLQSLAVPTADEPTQFMFTGLESAELSKFQFHKRADLGDIMSLSVKVTRELFPLDTEDVPDVVPDDNWATHGEDPLVTHAGDFFQFWV